MDPARTQWLFVLLEILLLQRMLSMDVEKKNEKKIPGGRAVVCEPLRELAVVLREEDSEGG